MNWGSLIKFKTLNGRTKDVQINKYRVDWEKQSLSKFQMEIKLFLQPYWGKQIVCEEFTIPSTRLSIDIFNVNLNLAIECQGRQHTQYVPFLSGSRLGYLAQLKRDIQKEEWCALNGIRLIEIFPEDVPLTKKFFKEKFDIIL